MHNHLATLVNYYVRPDFGGRRYEKPSNMWHQSAANELAVHTSDSTFLGGLFYDSLGNHILLYHPADRG
jgi:hypothetical protein